MTIRAAKVFAFTTTKERDRTTYAEAMATGCTVVVADHLESAAGEVDWFAVPTDADRPLYATLDRAVATGIVALVVYTENGGFSNQLYVGGEAPASVRISSTDARYVQVVDIENGAGGYTLELTADEPTTSTEAPTASPTGTTTDVGMASRTAATTSTAAPTTPVQGSHLSSAGAVPGRIEAENFDTGGSGVAYRDTDEDNRGGAYRDTGVDIQQGDGRYNVGWVKDGEWLEYTANVASGSYDVRLAVASPESGGRIRIRLDSSLLGMVTVPNTDGWNNWTTVTLPGVELDGGDGEVLRLEFVGDNGFLYDVDWIEFVEQSPTTTASPTSKTATPTSVTTTGQPDPTTTATTTRSVGYSQQRYGEYGYGGTV